MRVLDTGRPACFNGGMEATTSTETRTVRVATTDIDHVIELLIQDHEVYWVRGLDDAEYDINTTAPVVTVVNAAIVADRYSAELAVQ